MKTYTRKIVKVSKWKFALIIIAVLIVLFIWGVLSLLFGKGFDTSYDAQSPMMRESGYSVNSVSVGEMNSNKAVMDQMPEYYRRNQPGSIDDTREFLKTYYSSTIRTRNVQDTVNSVKNIVKGNDGRIDNFYSSEKRGSISFVVAKTKFDQFRDEVSTLTNAKLYIETISSENLLAQKQGIESQMNDVLTTLEQLKAQKTSLNTKHTQAVNLINSQLSSIQTQLVQIRNSINNATNTIVISTLRNQENSLINQEDSAKQRLSSENRSFANQNSNLDNQILNWNSNLDNVNKQDTQFTNNIEKKENY